MRTLRKLIILSAAVVVILAVCPSSKMKGLVDCISNSVRSEWTALQADPNGKLQKDENQMSGCVKSSGCAANVDFTRDWIDLLDPQLKTLAHYIRDFWNNASREVQQCILADIRDKFLGEVSKCVNDNGHQFQLPSDLGPFPVAPQALYASRAQSAPLNRYVDDRINALVTTKDCNTQQRHKIVTCMKADGDAQLKQCIRQNICSDPGCKADFPGTCDTFIKCIPIVLQQAGAKLTSLESGSSTGAISVLSNCGGNYSRVAAINNWKEILKIAKQGLSDKFKLLLKDLIKAYFTGEGLCNNTC